jgi:hypothetical protein
MPQIKKSSPCFAGQHLDISAAAAAVLDRRSLYIYAVSP